MNKNEKPIEEYSQETIQSSFYTAFLFNQNISRHRHLFFEFTYCLSGEITNIVNGKAYPTHALQELVLMRPGDIHEMIKETPDSNTPEYHRDIYCMKDKMKSICDFLKPGLFEEIVSSKDPIIIPCGKEILLSLESSLGLFKEAAFYSEEKQEQQNVHHTAIICRLLDAYLMSKNEVKLHYPAWIKEFLQSLGNEDVLRKSVNDIIKDMNYSRGYICREFKKYVGKTMVECLNDSRIAYSTILLANSNLSILDVAMALNFSSQGAFTNSFKKVHGISPSQWRKQQL